jgi:Kelch motif
MSRCPPARIPAATWRALSIAAAVATAAVPTTARADLDDYGVPADSLQSSTCSRFLSPDGKYQLTGDTEYLSVSQTLWTQIKTGFSSGLNADGSLGPFALVPGVTLVTPRSGHTGARIGNYLYVFGGRNALGYPDSIERALINIDGSLSMFTAVPA